ncbi:unnamed protein product, partial [Medioppia subpectinata]
MSLSCVSNSCKLSPKKSSPVAVAAYLSANSSANKVWIKGTAEESTHRSLAPNNGSIGAKTDTEKTVHRIRADLNGDNEVDVETNDLTPDDDRHYKRPVVRFGGFDSKTMKIVITVCGNETLKQSLITLKSAAILTKSRLHFIVMSDEYNRKIMGRSILNEWPKEILSRISFEIHLVSFPNTVNVEEWRRLFKLCAAQRLFLPTILKDIDSVLYVDTDVLFLTPVDQMWSIFERMNSTQMAAMSPESEDFASSWYYRFAKHPYVERLGVNSGVMLMNLTRMRDFHWTDYLEPYLAQYRLNI